MAVQNHITYMTGAYIVFAVAVGIVLAFEAVIHHWIQHEEDDLRH